MLMKLNEGIPNLSELPFQASEEKLINIIAYVKAAMSWYSKKPSAYLAKVVVTNLELVQDKINSGECTQSMCNEEGLDCECYRLLKKWRFQWQYRAALNMCKENIRPQLGQG